MIKSQANIKQTFVCCLMLLLLIPLFPLAAIWTQPPKLISIPGNETDAFVGVCLDVNASNNGVSVWVGDYPPNVNLTKVVYASSYFFGSGWTPVTILTNLSLLPNGNRKYINNGDSQVSLNEVNQAGACWEGSELTDDYDQFDGIYTATRNPDGNWNPQQRASAFNLESGFRTANPGGAINDSGTFVVVWVEKREDAGGHQFEYRMANFQQVGGNWGTPIQVAGPFTATFSNEKTPDVQINSKGDVVAIWKRNTGIGGISAIEAVTYDAALNTWSPVISLDLTGINHASSDSDLPRCGIDENGNAVAVWIWYDGTQTYRVYASSFTPGLGWGPRIILEETSTGSSLDSASVVMDRFGNSTAIWNLFGGGDFCEVHSSSLPLGGIWSIPVTISTVPGCSGIDGNFVQRNISVDLQGNVIVIFEANDEESDNLYSVSKLNCPPTGWQTPELISNDVLFEQQNNPLNLNIGLGSCGFAIANWQAQGDSLQVWASEHFGAPISACGFIGTQCREKFGMQSICINQLAWGSCCDANCILSYRLFKNGVQIATIPGNDPHVFTDAVACRGTNIYTLIAVDIYGIESAPAVLVLP